MKEAIKRADAYEKAGADAILIHSKQKKLQMKFLNLQKIGKEVFPS